MNRCVKPRGLTPWMWLLQSIFMFWMSCVIIFKAHMLSLVLILALVSNFVYLYAFPWSSIGFFQFSSHWNILNVAVDVNIHAFVGMHHYCTFVTVVSCPGVNCSLLCCFSMIFFHLEKSHQDRFLVGVSNIAADIIVFQKNHKNLYLLSV